jgi:hypothetical protein
MRGAPARFSDALPRSFRENEVIHGRWAMVRLSCIASGGLGFFGGGGTRPNAGGGAVA